MDVKPTVGWIGLGKLGLPIAGRLAAAGYAVAGHDRSSERLELAAAQGVRPAALAEACTAARVFSCLPDDRALLAATGGEAGLLAALAGGTYVDASTVSPEASAAVAREAEARCVTYLRLPISGNASIAHTGNLTCFASGPRAAFEAAQPVLA